MKKWSRELQDQTEQILRGEQPMVFAMNEQLGRKGVILKNWDSRFGYVELIPCLSGNFEVRDNATDVVLGSFTTISALLDAGWVVD